jgi:hypothetical protein
MIRLLAMLALGGAFVQTIKAASFQITPGDLSAWPGENSISWPYQDFTFSVGTSGSPTIQIPDRYFNDVIYIDPYFPDEGPQIVSFGQYVLFAYLDASEVPIINQQSSLTTSLSSELDSSLLNVDMSPNWSAANGYPEWDVFFTTFSRGDLPSVITFTLSKEIRTFNIPYGNDENGSPIYRNEIATGTGVISFNLVPEPSSLSLLALGGVVVALRRRR